MSPEILIAILAAAAVLLITYGIAARPSEDAVQARLSQLVVQPKSLEEMELQQPFFDRVMRPTIQRRWHSSIQMRTAQSPPRG